MSTRRLLTEPLPMRRAVDLPEYRADAAERWLPWVFGRAHVAAVPLDATGQDWIVADHPVVAVTTVSVNGQPTTGYELIQGRIARDGATVRRAQVMLALCACCTPAVRRLARIRLAKSWPYSA